MTLLKQGFFRGISYCINENRRLKYSRIHFNQAGELLVSVPARFNSEHFLRLLTDNYAWIKKTANDIKSGTAMPCKRAAYPPAELSFAANGEKVVFEYVYDENASKVTVLEGLGGQVVVKYNTEAAKISPELFKRLIHHQAKAYLVPLAWALSEKLGFTISRVTIRNQRTRWGSCTSRQTLSLNQKLLFISPDLVNYVLVHELAHTECLNHSPAFWQLVERYIPDHRQKHNSLKAAWHQLPPWLF